MKLWSRLWNVVCFLALTASALAAEFSPALEAELAGAKAGEFVSAIVILESPVDIRALDMMLHEKNAPLAERHREVIAALKYNAETTQPAFRGELEDAKSKGAVEGYTAYWIENLFVISATREFIEALESRGDVKYVTENFRAELIEPVRTEGRRREQNSLDSETTTPGQDAIQATRVNRELGITGQGVLVANCDTGVDGLHGALASRWRGLTAPWQECWRDQLGNGSTFPEDFGGHGTHVMGTITGREVIGTDTNTVGSAPDALWIATNSINQGVSSAFDNDIIDDYQWFADPDGNPLTLDDLPDVIQNSWGVFTGLGYAQCFDFWNTVILNCEAAGPVITWSAGNEDVSGLRSPAIYSINNYQIFAVAAVDATNSSAPYPLAWFSSQGPTPCTPAVPDNIKPDIAAPGVDVYSSVPGGGYDGTYSGTSMAGPHVAGVVALMRQACPDCDHMTIKDAIMNTAIDYGTAGDDNQYGHGFINAYDAVVAVSSLGHLVGNVTDGVNPLSGVKAKITSGPNFVLTNASGDYDLPLSDGTYDVEYSKFGYVTATVNGLVITTGNNTIQDVVLTLAPQGTVSGVVTDCDGNPANGATVEVLNVPVIPATTNGSGFYSISLPQGTYDMRASFAGCGSQTVTSVVVGVSATQNFTLPSDPRYQCSTPDPYGYVACEDVDAGGVNEGWQAVTPLEGGSGTSVNEAPCDDCYEGPFTFPFPFMFYGNTYTEYYIATNGFMTFGDPSGTYTNGCFPDDAEPAGAYVNWDDMYNAVGDVAYYYDAANHWLVISWYNVEHYNGHTDFSSFQAIIYDQLFYPTATGDNNLLFQYSSPLTQTTSVTVGIKDVVGLDFNQYQCDASIDAAAFGIEPGRTVFFSTGPACDLGDPEIAVNPLSVSGQSPIGGSDLESMQICNNGPCPLSWSADFNQFTPAALVADATRPVTRFELSKQQLAWRDALKRGEKPNVIPTRGEPTPLDAQGGPDAFGYSWIDSDEAGGPAYNWFDISGIGVNSGLIYDDDVTAVALPFAFDFYGVSYSSVNISSNGNVHFGPAYAAYWNGILPDPFAPLAMIAPLWDDLYLPQGGTIYYYDDAANNRFIVQWHEIVSIYDFGDVFTFQVILNSDGTILLQYENSMFSTIGYESATVGIQNESGTDGLQIAYDQVYLHDNMAIEISSDQIPDWLTISTPLNGTIDPGQCVTLDLTFTAGDLSIGVYTGEITIQSSDPTQPTVLVPVEYEVGSYTQPTNLTIIYDKLSNTLNFNWTATNAPWYQLFSSPEPDGALVTLEGATTGNSLSIPFGGQAKLFYVLVATSAP